MHYNIETKRSPFMGFLMYIVLKLKKSEVVKIKGINGKKVKQKSLRIDQICDVILFKYCMAEYADNLLYSSINLVKIK